MYKIKISLLNDQGEIDHIEREIPFYNSYNFIKGLLVDLNLLINRNHNYIGYYTLIEEIKRFLEGD